MRLSFNHINSNPKDHRLENLEVICFACNRLVSQKGTKDNNHHYKSAISAIELWKKGNKYPSLREIRENAGVEQIGGATYLLKFSNCLGAGRDMFLKADLLWLSDEEDGQRLRSEILF